MKSFIICTYHLTSYNIYVIDETCSTSGRDEKCI